jgi:hypothetical protein
MPATSLSVMLLAEKASGWDVLWVGLALAGLIIIGVLAIVWIRKSVREPLPGPSTLEEELSRYQALYDQGVLTLEEFDKVRAGLKKTASATPPVAPQSQPAKGSPPESTAPAAPEPPPRPADSEPK